jgi:signal transduction histidine kinase
MELRRWLTPTRCVRCCSNLLDNAVKYGPPSQHVVTRVERVADAIVVSVEDEGPGIPSRDRERIWRPFERASHPLLSRSGSGLGLTIVP